MEDIGAGRLAGLIPRPLSRPAWAGKFDQPMRAAPAAHPHKATRHLVASGDLEPFHDQHSTLERNEPRSTIESTGAEGRASSCVKSCSQ